METIEVETNTETVASTIDTEGSAGTQDQIEGSDTAPEESNKKEKKNPLDQIIVSEPVQVSSREELDEILSCHHTWMESVLNPTKKIGSGRANLSGSDLSGWDLTGVNLSGATLEGVNFEGATLERASLNACILRNTNFNNANLNAAKIRRAHIEGATFENIDFETADWKGTDIQSWIDQVESDLDEASEITIGKETESIVHVNNDSDTTETLTVQNPDSFEHEINEVVASTKPNFTDHGSTDQEISESNEHIGKQEVISDQ